MEDCDVLKDEIKVKLRTLTDRSDCIACAADLSIQEKWMETWLNNNEEDGEGRSVYFQNFEKAD